MKSQKIQFQESFPRISPVKVGPTAGANIITKAQSLGQSGIHGSMDELNQQKREDSPETDLYTYEHACS